MDPERLYALRLPSLGFDRSLPIRGPGQAYRAELEPAFGRLRSPRLDQLKVFRWLLDEPDAGSAQEVERTLTRDLEEAKTWERAAQRLLEEFYDQMMAENHH